VFKELGGYRALRAVEDYDFLLRAVESGVRLSNVPEQVLLYRRSPKGISYRNVKAQMANTRRVLALHRKRVAGKSESPSLLKKMREVDEKVSPWFAFWWRCRNNFLERRQCSQGAARNVLLAGVMISSLMHFELTNAAYRGWRSLRYQRGGENSIGTEEADFV
jgi:hypothetical protein